jgi:hypothetical protein
MRVDIDTAAFVAAVIAVIAFKGITVWFSKKELTRQPE